MATPSVFISCWKLQRMATLSTAQMHMTGELSSSPWVRMVLEFQCNQLDSTPAVAKVPGFGAIKLYPNSGLILGTQSWRCEAIPQLQQRLQYPQLEVWSYTPAAAESSVSTVGGVKLYPSCSRSLGIQSWRCEAIPQLQQKLRYPELEVWSYTPAAAEA